MLGLLRKISDFHRSSEVVNWFPLDLPLNGSTRQLHITDLGHPATHHPSPDSTDPMMWKIDKSINLCGGMRWHGWKKDGKWMGTCWEMGNGWKIWKLDGHGQVSWWSLYCLAHVQMLLHMFALTSESPVLLFSLSLILIIAHPARRTEWSTSDKANAHPVQWCGVLLVPSSGLPCENSCCTAAHQQTNVMG